MYELTQGLNILNAVQKLQDVSAEIDTRKAELDRLFAKPNRTVTDEERILDTRVAISNLEARQDDLAKEAGAGKYSTIADVKPNGSSNRTEERSITGYELRDGETFASRAGGKREFDLASILRGMSGRGSREERAALSGLAGTDGVVTLPQYVAADIIDASMEQSALVRAGARRIQMLGRTHTIPRIVDDAELTWRPELGPVAEVGPTIDAAVLTAKSVAGVAIVSWELLEDASGVASAVTASLARSVARAIDAAALAGSNVANAPASLLLDTDIPTTVLEFEAAPYSYDNLIDISAVLASNEAGNLSWVILPYNDIAGLRKLKTDSGGAWLGMPPGMEFNLIGSAEMSPTTAVVLAGAGSGAIVIGMINDVRIKVLNELYAVSQDYDGDTVGGATGFLVHARVDVKAVDPTRLLRVPTDRTA